MDVEKKFKLNMAALVVIVIVLIILVFLSATSGPFQKTEEKIPSDEGVLNTENLLKESEEEEDAVTTQEDTATESEQVLEEEGEDDVLATITFTDNQIPEEQLRPQYPDNDTDDEATYTVRLRASWSERLHPNWYPNGAHISPMVVWSHRLKNVIFKEDSIASDGMEIMAETGATQTLVKEIQKNILTGNVFSHTTGSVFNAPGEDKTQITATRNAPFITAVSMIAPSPDWFIAAQNILLYEDGRWLERVAVPAVLYDAGTDSGTTFTAQDDDTSPKNSIVKIKNAPSIPIASFEFVKE